MRACNYNNSLEEICLRIKTSSETVENMAMEIRVNPKILKLVTSLETNVTKAINEALNLWLKEKMTSCPITNQFCIHNNEPCNDCHILKESSLENQRFRISSTK